MLQIYVFFPYHKKSIFMNTGVSFLDLGMVMCVCHTGCITGCGHIKKKTAAGKTIYRLPS